MGRFFVHLHGKTKDSSCETLISKYLKRVSKINVKIIEHSAKNTPDEYLTKLKEQSNGSNLILLEEGGTTYSSIEFSEIIKKGLISTNNTHFAIGPASGFPKNDCNSISFSRMTFPHEIASVILLEQIYRATEIIGGTAYHKP